MNQDKVEKLLLLFSSAFVNFYKKQEEAGAPKIKNLISDYEIFRSDTMCFGKTFEGVIYKVIVTFEDDPEGITIAESNCLEVKSLSRESIYTEAASVSSMIASAQE